MPSLTPRSGVQRIILFIRSVARHDVNHRLDLFLRQEALRLSYMRRAICWPPRCQSCMRESVDIMRLRLDADVALVHRGGGEEIN